MCETDIPERIDYEAWIKEVFDHEVGNQPWSFDLDFDLWDEEADPQHAVDLLTRLWSEPDLLLDRFTRDQIGQGIHFLVNPGESSYGFTLLDPSVPLSTRLNCLAAIQLLYQRCFNRICSREYAHLASGPVNEANGICYMFWDVFCMYPRSKAKPQTKLDREAQRASDNLVIEECRRMGIDCDIEAILARMEPKEISDQERREFEQIEDVCLSVMNSTLEVDNPACQEGALHGLGHWASDYPLRVNGIIDDYLQRDVPVELREYALAARTGMVN